MERGKSCLEKSPKNGFSKIDRDVERCISINEIKKENVPTGWGEYSYRTYCQAIFEFEVPCWLDWAWIGDLRMATLFA